MEDIPPYYLICIYIHLRPLHQLTLIRKKYFRILNSRTAVDNFFSSISTIRCISVTSEQALDGLFLLILKFEFPYSKIKYVISNFVCPDSLDTVLAAIYSGNLFEHIRDDPRVHRKI